MKKIVALITALIIIFLAGCSPKEQVKKYELTDSDTKAEFTLYYKENKVTKFESKYTIYYADNKLTRDDAEKRFKYIQVPNIEGISIDENYEDTLATKTVVIDLSKTNIDALKKDVGFKDIITDDYLDINKINDLLTNEGFKDVTPK